MTHLVIIPRPQTILLILIFCPDAADARLVVEAGISPPISPGGEVVEDDEVRDHIVVKGEDPLKAEEAMAASLRVKSPSDINHQTSRKRWNSSTVSDSGTTWPFLPPFLRSLRSTCFSLASQEVTELQWRDVTVNNTVNVTNCTEIPA